MTKQNSIKCVCMSILTITGLGSILNIGIHIQVLTIILKYFCSRRFIAVIGIILKIFPIFVHNNSRIILYFIDSMLLSAMIREILIFSLFVKITN